MQFRLLFLPLVALLFMGAAKKPELTIRFHTTALKQEGASFAAMVRVGNPPRDICINKIPDISERDISAIYPFPAPDGTTGCAFKLDDNGRIHLDTLSADKKGSVLVCIVNGRAVTALLIDQHVKNGVLYIASGLTPHDIVMMRKEFRVMGEKKK